MGSPQAALTFCRQRLNGSITANDLAVWQAYPNAAFTLIRTLTSPPAETDEGPVGEEFCLGTFELRTGSNYSDGEK